VPPKLWGWAKRELTGVYDDLEAVAAFAKKNKLWFHVDGAHGGAAIFSKKYRHKVAGIKYADSVVIDGHKMMMLPTITTALLFKKGEHSYTTFSQKADYLLLKSEDEDWYNIAKRTFECTKTMMSIHWYTMLKKYGEEVFGQYVTHLYDMGSLFAKIIAQESTFEVVVIPDSNIVCFRFADARFNKETLNSINLKLRQELIEEGTFYIVQTKLRGIQYMRCTIMNPFTTEAHFKTLLKKIQKKLDTILSSIN